MEEEFKLAEFKYLLNSLEYHLGKMKEEIVVNDEWQAASIIEVIRHLQKELVDVYSDEEFFKTKFDKLAADIELVMKFLDFILSEASGEEDDEEFDELDEELDEEFDDEEFDDELDEELLTLLLDQKFNQKKDAEVKVIVDNEDDEKDEENEDDEENEEDKVFRQRHQEWIDAFMNHFEYQKLSEGQKKDTLFVLRCVCGYLSDLGVANPESWDKEDLEDVCLDMIPRKVAAPLRAFHHIGPVLIAFFNFLAQSKRLKQASKLAKHVKKIQNEIIQQAEDVDNWGIAKSFIMRAMDDNIDLEDPIQRENFIKQFNSLT